MAPNNPLTPKTEAFLRAVVALCAEHGVEICGELAVHVIDEPEIQPKGSSYVGGASSFWNVERISPDGVEVRRQGIVIENKKL